MSFTECSIEGEYQWKSSQITVDAAHKELRKLLSDLDKEKIKEATSRQKIKWHFNPQLVTHFGNALEIIIIKSAKQEVYDQFKNVDINDEELLSAFSGAEGLTNSRPVIYQSADVHDVSPVTSNHFLFG